MKNIVLTILSGIFLCACNSALQIESTNDQGIVYVKNVNIKGIILPQDYEIVFSAGYDTNRFAPTLEEIIIAEKILKDNIETANRELFNQGYKCPVIHRNLNKYFRQYFGQISNNGDKIITINFLWDRRSFKEKISGYPDQRSQYRKGYYFVLDGCSFYWQVSINIQTQKIVMLSVNGVA